MAQDDDNFGLPDLNFKPLEPKKQTPPPPPPPAKMEKKPVAPPTASRVQTAGPIKAIPKPGSKVEEKSNTSVIIGIAVPILLLVGGYFGYLYLYKKPKEKAAIEAAIAKEAADKLKKEQDEAARLAKLKEEEEAKLRTVAEAKPVIGTTEMLTAPTGRFYVIVASSVDDDLLADETQRMSAKGVSTKIIPPFGKWKYFRLTISDHDTFALAQSNADEAKAQYPGGTWVLRY